MRINLTLKKSPVSHEFMLVFCHIMIFSVLIFEETLRNSNYYVKKELNNNI